MLTPDEIHRIVERLRLFYDIVESAEITMECNPGSLNQEWLEGYRDAGINRLSFGVQSFDNDDLRFLTRIHTAEEAERNIRDVRRVFDNVSLDLIFALPDQTLDGWMENLRRAVDLGTDHISAYALIFEEGTPLHAMRLKGRVDPAPNEIEAAMYEKTVAFLVDNGLHQYETSNYARDGFACRHNIAYWERQGYDAFGPSAHSFDSGAGAYGTRRANVSSLTAWLQAVESDTSAIIMREELTQLEAIEEVILLGLRYRGIDLRMFAEIAGTDLAVAAPRTIERIVEQKWGDVATDPDGDERFRLTAAGSIFADGIALEMVREVEAEVCRA